MNAQGPYTTSDEFQACLLLARSAIGGYCVDYRGTRLPEAIRQAFIVHIADNLYSAVNYNDRINFNKHSLFKELDNFIENSDSAVVMDFYAEVAELPA